MFYWSFSATLANVLKSSATKLAPPINAPSIFGFFINSSILFSFTLPPYWIRIASAVALSYNDATVALINPHVSSATSAVAVLPVPIAQIGSYAITSSFTWSLVRPSKSFTNWFLITSSVFPLSLSSRCSPTQRIGV